MRKEFVIGSILILALFSALGYFVHPYFWYSHIALLPLFLLGLYEMYQKKRTLMRNYPLFGRLRYVMEALRPKIYQYFVESNTDGTPINRIYRSVVYQRAKQELSTTPFGTQVNVYEEGYEWINHSTTPLDEETFAFDNLRVKVGNEQCKQPYSLSIFNISAMSFGALSSHAVEALNWGAQTGNFAHNTGEGGVSPHHLKYGGDLIWQIGTGYFGCRTEDGKFCEEKFAKTSNLENVKMIEIKLSQGAKPGHGGILPASKNTKLIASIRGVKPHTEVLSPPRHRAFCGPVEMMNFVKKLRDLSNGKPIGFKLCFGNPEEFEEICQAMVETNIYPDFITIDGGEGGTGAAPLEFSNSIGMSLMDGLVFSTDILNQYGIRDKIKIICAGKLITAFDIVKSISMGADACYSARAMMLALGCIQALECNNNHCPTGIATQNPRYYKGLDVGDKRIRVANYHKNTIHSVGEILIAAGLEHTSNLNRTHIWRRVSPTEIKRYSELYPHPKPTRKSA